LTVFALVRMLESTGKKYNMIKTAIKCPHCQQEIDVNDALTHDLNEHYKRQLKVESERIEKELLQQSQGQLKEIKNTVNEELNSKFEKELCFLKDELAKKSSQVEKLQSEEIMLRSEKLRIEDERKALKLEVLRKVDEERKQITESIRKEEQENHYLILKQKEKDIEDIKKQLDTLKRRMEQGSVQAQGEIQELEIERALCEIFPMDSIEEVSKGVNGADILHRVFTAQGKECGIIAFESKRTKNFNERWIEKLKEDMRRHRADAGVLITEAMPSDMSSFGFRDGVWICSFQEFKGLAAVIRDGLLKVSLVKLQQSNSREKMKLLYDYLTSNEFKQQMEAIVDEFGCMKNSLDSEKRVMVKLWKEREKQIDRVLLSTVDMYGSVKGIAGSSIKEIEGLTLESLLPENASTDHK
jgi:hypothetical protein